MTAYHSETHCAEGRVHSTGPSPWHTQQHRETLHTHATTAPLARGPASSGPERRHAPLWLCPGRMGGQGGESGHRQAGSRGGEQPPHWPSCLTQRAGSHSSPAGPRPAQCAGRACWDTWQQPRETCCSDHGALGPPHQDGRRQQRQRMAATGAQVTGTCLHSQGTLAEAGSGQAQRCMQAELSRGGRTAVPCALSVCMASHRHQGPTGRWHGGESPGSQAAGGNVRASAFVCWRGVGVCHLR